MKRTITLVLIISAAVLSLVSCRTTQLPDISPYQKRADIIIESDDYSYMNNKAVSLSTFYEGFLKTASVNKKEGKYASAELNVKVPYRFFNDYLEALRKEFGPAVVEEKIADEDSYSRLYSSTNEKIDKLKNEIELMTDNSERSKDVDDRIVAGYEIDKKKKELEDLNSKRLSLLEDMNYSTVNITWRNIDKPDFEEVVYANTTEEEVKEEAIAGEPPVREIVFKEYYQTETFGTGEPVKIVFQGLDPKKTDLISKVDFENNMIALTTVPFGKKEKVTLDTKCQIINVGVGPLPEIEASEDVNREQIVITPRVDDECNVIGYEIRAGTIESGCILGRINLKRYKDCFRSKGTKKNTGTFIKPKNKILKDEDLKWFYLMPKD